VFLRSMTGVVFLQLAGGAFCANQAQSPATNLDVLRGLAAGAAAEIRKDLVLLSSERVAVTVLPEDIAWTVDEGILSAFAPQAAAMESAGVVAVFGIRDVQIGYQDIERDGLFGPKTAARVICVTFSVRVTRTSSGALLVGRDVDREYRDRIQLDEIPLVEHPTLALARGSLASEGVFPSLAEPMILIGAIGVAVFLLFHVRS